MKFEVKESSDTKTIKELFVEYSHIKGAEQNSARINPISQINTARIVPGCI